MSGPLRGQDVTSTRNPDSIGPLKPATSLRDRIGQLLSTAIIAGEFAPRELVSVPTLAARFGVSATPVREAMLDLEKRGFVESVRNRGFRVTEVSDRDIQEIVQIRRWLEGAAMREVADRFADVDREPYRRLADDIVEAAGRSDFSRFLAADNAFHLALLELAENGRLVRLVSELRSQTRLVGLVRLADTVELEKSAAEHHELLELLIEGHGEQAERFMHGHISHVVGWWAGRSEGGGR